MQQLCNCIKMNYFKHDDLIDIDDNIRKNCGKTILYVIFPEKCHSRWEYGPCIFLNCNDALKYASSFILTRGVLIRQEVHSENVKPVVRTFKQYLKDCSDTEDSYIVYKEQTSVTDY